MLFDSLAECIVRASVRNSVWANLHDSMSGNSLTSRFVTFTGAALVYNDSKIRDDESFDHRVGHRIVPFMVNGAEVQLFTSTGDAILDDTRAQARSLIAGAFQGPGRVAL